MLSPWDERRDDSNRGQVRDLLKLLWMIIAGIAITVAAVFLWFGDFTSAFVVAAIGLVAWFLNYRIQMKEVVLASNLSNKDTVSQGADED